MTARLWQIPRHKCLQKDVCEDEAGWSGESSSQWGVQRDVYVLREALCTLKTITTSTQWGWATEIVLVTATIPLRMKLSAEKLRRDGKVTGSLELHAHEDAGRKCIKSLHDNSRMPGSTRQSYGRGTLSLRPNIVFHLHTIRFVVSTNIAHFAPSLQPHSSSRINFQQKWVCLCSSLPFTLIVFIGQTCVNLCSTRVVWEAFYRHEANTTVCRTPTMKS